MGFSAYCMRLRVVCPDSVRLPTMPGSPVRHSSPRCTSTVALWVLNGRKTRWAEYLFQPGSPDRPGREARTPLYSCSLVMNHSLAALNHMPQLSVCTSAPLDACLNESVTLLYKIETECKRTTDSYQYGNKVRMELPHLVTCIYFHSIHRASRWMDHMYA